MDGDTLAHELREFADLLVVGGFEKSLRTTPEQLFEHVEAIIDAIKDGCDDGSVSRTDAHRYIEDLMWIENLLREFRTKFSKMRKLRSNPGAGNSLRRLSRRLESQPLNPRTIQIEELQDDHLTEDQERFFRIVRGSSKPMTAKEILDAYQTQHGIEIEEATFTRHHVPALKAKRGLVSKRGVGYYLPGIHLGF